MKTRQGSNQGSRLIGSIGPLGKQTGSNLFPRKNPKEHREPQNRLELIELFAKFFRFKLRQHRIESFRFCCTCCMLCCAKTCKVLAVAISQKAPVQAEMQQLVTRWRVGVRFVKNGTRIFRYRSRRKVGVRFRKIIKN